MTYSWTMDKLYFNVIIQSSSVPVCRATLQASAQIMHCTMGPLEVIVPITCGKGVFNLMKGVGFFLSCNSAPYGPVTALPVWMIYSLQRRMNLEDTST